MSLMPTPHVPLTAMSEAMLNQALNIETDRSLTDSERYLVLSAALAATHLHTGQERSPLDDDETPYIEHLLRNTLRLMRWGVRNDMVLTASLMRGSVEYRLITIITDYTPHSVPPRESEFTADQVAQMREKAYAWLGEGYGDRVGVLVERLTRPLHMDHFEPNVGYFEQIAAMVETARRARETNAPIEPTIAFHALLIEASALVDNAINWLDQRDPASSHDLGLVEEYNQAISTVLDELREHRLDVPAERGSSELDRLLTDLKELRAPARA